MPWPYYYAQQRDKANGGGSNGSSEWYEGGIMLLLNVSVGLTVLVLDGLLLGNEFKTKDTPSHIVQTGALVSGVISVGTGLLFWLGAEGYSLWQKVPSPFATTASSESKTLPPFGTALITGGLKATLGLTYVLALMTVLEVSGVAKKRTVELLVAQIVLKHLGTALALSNHRLEVFTSVPITNPVG